MLAASGWISMAPLVAEAQERFRAHRGANVSHLGEPIDRRGPPQEGGSFHACPPRHVVAAHHVQQHTQRADAVPLTRLFQKIFRKVLGVVLEERLTPKPFVGSWVNAHGVAESPLANRRVFVVTERSEVFG
jgi:hypothetical protein